MKLSLNIFCMKITLTCAEADAILCEAVKKKYESSFLEAHNLSTYEKNDRYGTFDVMFDGNVVNNKLSMIGDICFEAINIKRASDKPDVKRLPIAA